MSKNEYLNKNGQVNQEMHSTYAELFYDFWVKVMKLHYPAASEEDFLDVFKRIIENKEEQLKMKRGRSTMDEEEDGDLSVREPIRDGSVDTTPAETPPLAKESLFNFPSETQLKLFTTFASTLSSGHQDSIEDARTQPITMPPKFFLDNSTTNASSMETIVSRFEFEDDYIHLEAPDSVDEGMDDGENKLNELYMTFLKP